MPVIFAIVFALLSVSSSLHAQETPPVLVDPEKHADSSFVKDFLLDQQDLWESPLKIKRGDVKWLAPIGLGAAALLSTDWRVSETVRRSESLHSPSKAVSKLGGGLPMAAASASLWTIGKLTNNDRVARTGRLATAAVLQTELLVGGIKLIASRERPDKIGGHGGFRDGGQSFPSGHTATSFAFATVVAHEYRDKPWVSVGAYGLATAIGLSRVGGLRHFPSDVLIGATIGHLIGRYILRHHE